MSWILHFDLSLANKSERIYTYLAPFVTACPPPDRIRPSQLKLVKNLSSVPEAHRRLSGRPLLPIITRLWEQSPDETTSKLACHVLANLSRSDVHGVRNRLFKVSVLRALCGLLPSIGNACGWSRGLHRGFRLGRLVRWLNRARVAALPKTLSLGVSWHRNLWHQRETAPTLLPPVLLYATGPYPLFRQSHLAAESEAMCRKTGGGTSPASGPSQKLSPASTSQVQQSQHVVAPGAGTAARPNDTHDDGDTVSSISSSVFRRDDSGKGGSHSTPQGKNAAALLLEESSLRDARLDAQHRLRLLPAALWGERARLADVNASDAVDGEETEPAAATQLQRTFLTEGMSFVPSAKEGSGPAAALNHQPERRVLDASTGRKRRKNDAAPARESCSRHHHADNGPVNTDGGDGGSGFVLPIGAPALFSQAASLKRTAVTASVPLRWQSRVIALSSLRDSFRESATRGSPSMGRMMAIRRCRAYQRTKKAKRFGNHNNKSPCA